MRRPPIPTESPRVARPSIARLLPAVAAIAGAVGVADAGTIVWISQVQGPAGQEFLTLLRAQGHTVNERILTSALLTPEAIDEMNAASLVIFGRKAASGNYNTPDWDAITAPMIVLTPYMTRSSIWGWFNGTGLADQVPAQMTVHEPAHGLFAGVTVTDGTTGAWHVAVDRGPSFATDVVDNGGLLLASTPTGAVAAAEWPTDTVASGPRLLLCMGSREADGAAIETAGKFNLTPLGEQILLNAVNLYVPPVDPADTDGDGVINILDAFPTDPAEWEDTDGDGIGNNADPDDDNDGAADAADAFPRDPAESKDTDGDGIGDNADPDGDNDYVPDAEDAFPANPAEWDDSDGDGLGDNADPDADGNGIADPPVSRVVWVSQVESEVGQEFIELLTSAGHTVTRFAGTSATLTATPALVARVMNTADLIIFSRQTSSDQYSTAIWDQLKTPMLVMSPYVLRGSRWAWFPGEELTAGTPAFMALNEPNHALFAGLPVEAGTTGPWHTFVDQETSFMNDLNVVDGTVLATTDAGALAAAHWPPGTVAAGPRLYLAMGAWEAAGSGATNAGNYNLTELGARVLLNAVALFTAPVTPSRFDIASVSRDPATGHVTLTWPSSAGQTFTVERSADLVTWSQFPPIVGGAGATTSFTDQLTAPVPPALHYRVVRGN
jgi:hypothetical protein